MPSRSWRRIVTIAVLLVALSFFAVLGYRYWYEPTYDFVEVTDAQVTGYLTKVGAPAPGRIDQLFYNVGDVVHTGDTIATVEVVAASGNPAATGPNISRVLAHITSPVDGRVAAQWVSVGDTVSAGEPIVTIGDLNNLWVVANVDEGRIGQITRGEDVNITIADLGTTLHGTVSQIGSATTEAVNPSAASAFSSTDTTQKVPVRIAVDWGGAKPVAGMTADTTIYVNPAAEVAISPGG